MIDGSETNILDFIPPAEHAAILEGTSTYDCGPDITTAINALKGGTKAKALFFPKGTYNVATTITITSLLGFVFSGEGTRSTIIRYTPASGSLFYFTTYVDNAFYNMAFYSAEIENLSRTNICFRLNGLGGGTQLLFQNVFINGFHTAVRTKDAVVNEDTVTFNSCYFWSNIYVWDNSNEQAVSWTFNECQVLFTTGVVFYNPGGFMRVLGGSYIFPGTLIRNDTVSTSFGIIFDGLKFEPNNQYLPSGSPPTIKYVTLGGVSGLNAIFKNCNDTTSYPIITTNSFELKNDFNLQFEACIFTQGEMEVLANFSAAGRSAFLVFTDSSTPEITETVYPENAGQPTSKIYNNSQVIVGANSGSFTGSMVRYLTARTSGIPITPAIQKLSVRNTNITASTDFPFYIPIPVSGLYVISALDFYYRETDFSIAATITLWTDATKTVKIYEYSKAASTGTKLDTANLTSLITAYAMTSASAPLVMSVTCAAPIGIPTITMMVTLSQFA